MKQKAIDILKIVVEKHGEEKAQKVLSLVEEMGADASIELLMLPKTGIDLKKLETRIRVQKQFVEVKC